MNKCFGFSKSRKKWQKTFINEVFKRKTKYQDSYTKIIINNLSLLDIKRNLLPKSLYKFYSPTSDNIDNIRRQNLWLSHPKTFNDPFDCQIGYDTDEYAKRSLLKHIKVIGLVDNTNINNGFTAEEFTRLNNSSTSVQHWLSRKEEYDQVLRKILETKSEEFKNQMYKFTFQSGSEVRTKMNKLRDINIRVACFSALDIEKGFDNMIQMWSHYADQHRGFCVEFDITPLKDPALQTLEKFDFYNDKSGFMDERLKPTILGGLFPIIYSSNRVNVPLTKLEKINPDKLGESKDENAKDILLYKTYLVKSANWSYEKEWRLVLDGDICDFYDNKIPFPFIKTIYLGCKMSPQNVDNMFEISENLGVEIRFMKMGSKKFSLEEHPSWPYKYDRERKKFHCPYF